MRTFLEWLRGDGSFKSAPSLNGNVDDFSGLNRRKQDWPCETGWICVLPPPTSSKKPSGKIGPITYIAGSLGNQIVYDVEEASEYDWMVPEQAQRIRSPGCGVNAAGEFSLTFGSSISVSALGNIPGLGESLELSVGFEVSSSSSTTVYMDSDRVEPAQQGFEYMVTPLLEVFITRRKTTIKNIIHPMAPPVSMIKNNPSFTERWLYTKVMSFAICKRPCSEER